MKTLFFRLTLLIAAGLLLFNAACQKQQPAAGTTTATPTQSAIATPEASPSPSPQEPAKLVPVEFTDVTQPAGIHFRHNNGAYGKKYMPETNGSGCAFIDYDNDGWQDILLINSMDFEDSPQKGQKPRRSTMALYHNNQ